MEIDGKFKVIFGENKEKEFNDKYHSFLQFVYDMWYGKENIKILNDEFVLFEDGEFKDLYCDHFSENGKNYLGLFRKDGLFISERIMN